MKLVLYDSNDQVIEIVEGINNPKISDGSIQWDGGSLVGLKASYLFFDDSVSINHGDILTADVQSTAIDTSTFEASTQDQIKNLQAVVNSFLLGAIE
ncbi:hypothetical protein PU629_07325 [Pullulanibacillus sp. KACC 23026]|uniref:hypothetical protein n=1 Tax=Pullulanibacillus sp. KACC 23026 TaxID=3028315 RepID=UPI0023AEF0FC|nr:hypothetical protein [Pullulanibacillus sp. KACC 23026]WEG14168.1 hypothetical protein PU629_07325 [Pullulanibacillus sp. KACC 23026]